MFWCVPLSFGWARAINNCPSATSRTPASRIELSFSLTFCRSGPLATSRIPALSHRIIILPHFLSVWSTSYFPDTCPLTSNYHSPRTFLSFAQHLRPGYWANNYSTYADTTVLKLFAHALSWIPSSASLESHTITSKTSLFHQTSLLDILAFLLTLVTLTYNSTSNASPRISVVFLPWIPRKLSFDFGCHFLKPPAFVHALTRTIP
ncbi:hypothetical protein Moror_11773 [Moniliophthora roreri MCA 2997]|uniref:Uncharacterized protein n=1 Tax=Moniliophthora roreri (strain MCA 2997) TaxID=1381753 RepID=V2W842_MONRO|nr:hypothetical protein Moror_11773 [Moniliophthora roreri MCA 2997]